MNHHCYRIAGVQEAGWSADDEPPPPYRLLLDGKTGAQEPTQPNIRRFDWFRSAGIQTAGWQHGPRASPAAG